jgi:hypothetical protein
MDAVHEGFCVKCKAKKTMVEPQQVDMKNGRKAIKGRCPDCNTGMYKILPKAIPAATVAAATGS